MLYLYQSNQLETLCAALDRILEIPAGGPLQANQVVVQNLGMARWLSQKIAENKGIAANIKFLLPASFIGEIFEFSLGQKADISAFKPEVLQWKIMNQLLDMGDDPAMTKVAAYLADDLDGSKLHQLTKEIATLFDQYLVYRPKMILEWEREQQANDEDSRWQAKLWRKLNPEQNMHWATLLKLFHQATQNGSLVEENLPSRICFFGINALAPAYLEVINQLGQLTEAHLFQLSPCRQYWDNILPERILAIKRKHWRQKPEEFADYFDDGNPLLASMGLAGQEFVRLTADFNPQTIKLYQMPSGSDLLSLIQSDIINADDRKQHTHIPIQQERSIQFHCCHSPMREIQVLHNRLLDLFAADAELKPSDILVMAPDIECYAPLISGVFDSVDKKLYIPWSISDLCGLNDEPEIEAFISLIQLPGSRYTAPEIMALLENPSIMARFEISEDNLGSIRACIADAGVRWGLDQQQRKQQGLEDSPLHTWEFAIERLLMGYITGPLDKPVANILPSAGKLNHSAAWLGQLANFFQALKWLERTLNSTPQRPVQWLKSLQLLLKIFFPNADNNDSQSVLRRIREALLDFSSDCKSAGFEQPLTLAVMRSHLLNKLSAPPPGQTFLKGSINFCKMTPMRALPFKVIWLLGMNNTQYPRSHRPLAFDLIDAKLVLGDRSRRTSDQYFFLETLLSARKQLCISWQGRHPRTNDALQPSVVVAELRDYIDRICAATPEHTASELLTTEHPLQAFSRRCYDGQPNTSSYAAHWLPISVHPDQQLFISQHLNSLIEERQGLDINELLRYWTHPVRYFAQQRLGLGLWRDNKPLEEAEAFLLDPLSQYKLKQGVLKIVLDGQDPQAELLRMQASGNLPRAEIGRTLYAETLGDAKAMKKRLDSVLKNPVKPLAIDINVADSRLYGYLDSLDQSGQYSYGPSKIKGKDILLLWLRHLLLLLAEASNMEPLSRHFAEDETICFGHVAKPLAELEPFIEGYHQGTNQPLHFYPQTSYVLARVLRKNNLKTAMSAALKVWSGSDYSRGEYLDTAYQICFRGLNEASILDPDFEQLADLYQAPLKHIEFL